MLFLVGLENLGIGTDLSTDCGGQHGPAMVLFRVIQGFGLGYEVITRLRWKRVRLLGPSPSRSARAAGVGHDVIADGMIPPSLGLAAAPPRSPVLILRDGRGSISFTGKPAGLHVLDMLNDRLSFLRLRSRIGLDLLLRQLTGMDDDKAPFLRGNSSIAVLDLDLAHHATAMPTTGLLVLRPPGLLD